MDNKEYMIQWHKDNPQYASQYYLKNKEKIRSQNKKWYENNPEKAKKCAKQWRKNNTEKIKKDGNRWKKDNPEKVKKIKKRYRKKNSAKIIEHNNKYIKEERRTNPKFNLDRRMGSMMSQSLQNGKNGYHWEILVGYTLEDLIKKLKKTMPKGYNWEDYMEGKLHIDHKIPISAFNYTKPEHIDFRRCWALSNLRLLPARENLVKGSKLLKPFQPALKI